MDITSGILNFFSIFTTLYDWMVNNTFIIAGIEFSYISLMWSVIVVTMFIKWLFKLFDD